MDYPRALTQIAEIHQQIAKGEIYRGYRSAPIAASGIVGLIAALAQPASAAAQPEAFVRYWATVAAIAAVVGLSEVGYIYIVRDHASGRRRTRQVLGQFLPAAFAAAMITAVFPHVSASLVALLPGLWAVCFGVGTFASRPYLPRMSGYVALFYVLAGFLMLWNASLGGPLHAWHVGGTFGAGQLLAAAVLYWELERTEYGSEMS